MSQNGEVPDRTDDLRAELERVKQQRDAYRSDLRDILLKHYDVDLYELEDIVREVQAGRSKPLSTVIADLKAEMGLPS